MGRLTQTLTEVEIFSGWQELADYLCMMESYIDKIQDEFEKTLKKLEPAKQHDYLVENPDEYLSINQEFPRILWNSFFVSACSLLQYCLGLMSKRFKDTGIRISYDSFRGKGTQKSRDRLLPKLNRIGIPNGEKYCEEISNYIVVRNSIVHQNGLLKNDDIELISYAKRKSIDERLTDEKIIVLTKQFCEEAMQTMEKFVDAIYNKLSAKNDVC